MVSSIRVSKGCVAKCAFCQRGKGYTTYKLEDSKNFIHQNYDVGFLMDDENLDQANVHLRGSKLFCNMI